MALDIEGISKWAEEAVAIRNLLAVRLGADHPLLDVLCEKAISPFHYWKENQKNGTDPSRRGHFVPESRSPFIPAASPTKTVAVEVHNTRPQNATVMKEWKLRWSPERKVWHGSVPAQALPDFEKYCVGIGLKVVVV